MGFVCSKVLKSCTVTGCGNKHRPNSLGCMQGFACLVNGYLSSYSLRQQTFSLGFTLLKFKDHLVHIVMLVSMRKG